MSPELSFKGVSLTKNFIKDKSKAETFVQLLDESMNDTMTKQHEHLATKSDLADLKIELMEVITNQKTELKTDIAALQLQIKDQKVELMEVIANQKADLTKSIYTTGLVQFLAIVASLIGILALWTN